MRKKILFLANGGKSWIGGLYYVKNMIFALTQYKEAMDNLEIFILTTKENKNLFEQFSVYPNVNYIITNNFFSSNSIANKIINKISNIFFDRSFDFNVIHSCFTNKIDYIYPVQQTAYLFFKEASINWIPDFQHIHLPQFFSENDIAGRDNSFGYFAKNHSKLVLSSDDAYKDYKKLYPNNLKNVYTVPFVSALTQDEVQINVDIVKEKYSIKGEFFFVGNQFWVHKNHKLLFEAINIVVNKFNKNILLLCTGYAQDYRNKEYFNQLLKYIEDNKLSDNIKILGFIDRIEQIALIKSSIAVVQPSLFEGWGTLVEDAKTIGKHIILSDISVHKEQKNDKCKFFDRNNADELAVIMMEKLEFAKIYAKEYQYDVSRAEQYGKMFCNMLLD